MIASGKAIKLRVYHLSKSGRDDLVENVTKISHDYQLKSKDLKVAEADDPSYVMIFDENQKIFLGRKGESDYFPLLKDESILPSIPSVTVDSGAVKFVCNGANIMRPGITKIEGEFKAKDLIVVKEQKYGKMIAIGSANFSRTEMESATKGPVIANLHYVGDKFWEMLKEIRS